MTSHATGLDPPRNFIFGRTRTDQGRPALVRPALERPALERPALEKVKKAKTRQTLRAE